MPAIIQSIQQISITIAAAATSATGTISAVNTANAALFINGRQTTYTLNAAQNVAVAVTLTNSTTVTASRGATTNTVTIGVTVVEFVSSVVNSVQYGSMAMAGSSVGTYTLPTSVGANSFVIYNGTTGTSAGGIDGYFTLNQGTGVVTATANTTSTATYYFCVVDLNSTAIVNVQQATLTGNPGTVTTRTFTLATSVIVANTILVYGGLIYGGVSYNQNSYTAQLTNATTVTFTRNTGVTGNSWVSVTAVQFQSNVLTANAVQRGTTTLSSVQITNTSTLPNAVNTAYALCNYCGFQTAVSTSLSAPQCLVTELLTDATTETSALNTANNTNVSSWEVVEFLSSVTAQPQGLAILNP